MCKAVRGIACLIRFGAVGLCALLLAACTNGTAVKSTSFASGGTAENPFGSERLRSGRRSGRDQAPKGSYTKAPKGAFDSRNYVKTRLNPRQALKMINRYRAQKGLKPLRLNRTLTKSARAHARDLAKHDRISHYGFDGSDPWVRVKRAGYHPQLAAENVGTGQKSLREVFRGWQESPGHNANLLLPDATQMGIALVKNPKSEYKTFWVLNLGKPSS